MVTGSGSMFSGGRSAHRAEVLEEGRSRLDTPCARLGAEITESLGTANIGITGRLRGDLLAVAGKLEMTAGGSKVG